MKRDFKLGYSKKLYLLTDPSSYVYRFSAFSELKLNLLSHHLLVIILIDIMICSRDSLSNIFI